MRPQKKSNLENKIEEISQKEEKCKELKFMREKTIDLSNGFIRTQKKGMGKLKDKS